MSELSQFRSSTNQRELEDDLSEYIEIEALEPPFFGTIRKIKFVQFDKILAISEADYDRVCNFLGGDPVARQVVLEVSPDSHRIRISSVQ